MTHEAFEEEKDIQQMSCLSPVSMHWSPVPMN